MSPERRLSSSDGTSPALEQNNVIASTAPSESSHVLEFTPSHHHPNNNQQLSMNVDHHPGALYHHNLHNQQHQQLQQNNVSITTVHNETSKAISTSMATILTSTYNNLAPKDIYSTVVTLSGPPPVTTTASTTTTMASNSPLSGAKLLVLHPNQLNDSFKSSKLYYLLKSYLS